MSTPRPFLALLATAAALAASPPAALAADADNASFHGQIRAMRVIGEVEAVSDADHAVTPLHNGDLLYEGYTVITHEQASVVLVFSNGSTLRLMPDTKLAIEKFLQSPFDEEELDVGKLAKEPSPSTTNLRLSYGELVGEVLPLHPGSVHEIETPVGAAGIRGTIFRHVYRTGPEGLDHYALDTDAGVVEFTAPDGRRTPVPAGKEFGGFRRQGQAAGRVHLRLQALPPHARFVLDHHLPYLRAAARRTVFHRADGRFEKNVRPKLRRDPAGKRDTDDDIRGMDREERERTAQPPARTPRTRH